jgi:hypothetical protein
VRLRITRQPTGSVDGIRLDDFILGFVYDMGTTLGSYLLAQGLAEPADDDATGLVPPLSDIRFSVITSSSDGDRPSPDGEPLADPSAQEPLSEAADRQRPVSRKRRPGEPSST